MPVRLERTYRFSAAHRYHRPEWSDEENSARFGKCAISPGHGHNYRLTLALAGPIDETTGFIADLGWLDALVEERVLSRLDHQHINHAVADFAPGRKVPTSENLATWVRDQLAPAIARPARLVEVRVAEDDDLAAVWTAMPEATPGRI